MHSIFDVIGPIMIGPSSSHTAGAARLARVAMELASRPFTHVSFGLHGSFFDTYRGHGTDLALLAGALGLREDDESIRDAVEIAAKTGLTYDYHRVALDDVHENSVEITFHLVGGDSFRVIGSSVGGGQILIRRVGDLPTSFSANLPTLLVEHLDRRGMISEITQVLGTAGINIGTMRTRRRAKGDYAACVVETDEPIPSAVLSQITALADVYSAKVVNLSEGVSTHV